LEYRKACPGTKRCTTKTDERLKEMSCGEIEGTTFDERISKWGSDWERHELGVEDDESIISRGITFISDDSNSLQEKNINY
jgi:2,3-bisphosphoglycerate-dependent phosphoglycerate mutase